jgi:hypothetical protein
MRSAASRRSESGASPALRSRSSGHVGLDSEASSLLNDPYHGNEIDEARRACLLALFRLEYRDPADMLERVRRGPVGLGLAMTPGQCLKLKPHNLLIKLPLARRADQSGA